MEAIIVIFVITILVSAGFLFLFFGAVNGGQYQNNEAAANRILFEDGISKEKKEI